MNGTPLNRLQGMLAKPWQWAFDGCHLNRETNRVLGQAGFSALDMDFRFRHTTTNIVIAGEIRPTSPQGVGVRLIGQRPDARRPRGFSPLFAPAPYSCFKEAGLPGPTIPSAHLFRD